MRLEEEATRTVGHTNELLRKIASLENELSTCIRPHEASQALWARLWEGINISRRIVQLVDPNFLVGVLVPPSELYCPVT
ncbi:hypothetical protein Nepgr_021797 [Nepenthes gracilis]|uniref:Uncharacterized protein n=1 Tax=Nepenthes gracilis TaxID=150966 RepID=A0AAD3T1H6_NEPGR|nr:hypothetical protein Nepgr_021797 [Nepenthes gracilis]